MYCSAFCKNKASRLKRAADPVKRAHDTAKKAEYRQSPRGRATLARLAERDRQRTAAKRAAKRREIDLILDDWVWIGPFEGWSAERAAPRIGVGHDRLLKILKDAREAGDPRGVIPETYDGMRLYSAA